MTGTEYPTPSSDSIGHAELKRFSAVATVRDITRQMVIPQGFTLSVAGTIATLVGERSDTRQLAIWLFVIGAGIGYGLVGVASGAHRRSAPATGLTITGLRLLNLVPILVVPLATEVANQIPCTEIAFASAGFLAVAAYIVALSGFLWLFAHNWRCRGTITTVATPDP